VPIALRVERRASVPLALRVGVLAAAVVLGVIAGGLVVQLTGYDAVKAFSAILEGSFDGAYPISQTLAAAIPLATIALGTSVAFRVQLWNIGGEGQFYMGAFGATAVELIGGPGGWPPVVLIPAMLLAGFAAGAAWALVPAWLRAWHGTNEIITTLMLNYVAVLWVDYLVYGPWKDPAGHNFPFSPRYTDNAVFERMGDGQLHTGLLVPIVAALVLLFAFARTRWGYELRVVGENPDAARYAGINVKATMLSAMLVSGGLAGIAGMVQVAGIIHLLNGQLSSNYGYTAIIVAWLARLNPLAVLVVSVLFGALVNGGYAVSQVGIPQAFGAVLQGMILFFLLGVGDLFTRYRVRIVSTTESAAASAQPPTS
jgi:simple sugar transport system permease protein